LYSSRRNKSNNDFLKVMQIAKMEFELTKNLRSFLISRAFANWAAYPEGYDVGSVADAMVNGDGGFYSPVVSSSEKITSYNMTILIYNLFND
jgi:hypothetical protein